MATTQYYQWVGMGRPYVLIRPAKDHQTNIRKHGFTVYDYPDDSHLQSNNPQDHTPFSRTKWPIGGIGVDGEGRAIDIMPKSGSAASLKELADMARQIIRDKDNNVDGTQAIKYMNWTDENGACWNENWKSGKRVTTSSTDKGHIHISYRDDMDTRSAVVYDPVARMSGESVEDDMTPDQDLALQQVLAIVRADRWQWDTDKSGFVAKGGNPAVWDYGGGMGENKASRYSGGNAMFARDDQSGQLYKVEAGMSSRVSTDTLDDAAYVLNQRGVRLAGPPNPDNPSAEWVKVTSGTGQFWVRTGWSAEVFGPPIEALLADLMVGGVTHEQLVAAFQDPAVIAAIKQAAFEGAQDAEKQ